MRAIGRRCGRFRRFNLPPPLVSVLPVFAVILVAIVFAGCAATAPATVPAGPGTSTSSAATAPEEPPTYIPAGAESLCEPAFSSAVTGGAVSAPIRTLISKDYEGGQWYFDPNAMMAPHVEPQEPVSRIATLLCIKESRVQEVTYPDGEVGYRVMWDARLVQYPGGAVVGAQQFQGGPPPDAELWAMRKPFFPPPAYGDRPKGSLLEWLFSLLDDPTVLCQRLSVFAIGFSPDGASLAAGGSGNVAGVWNVATGERTHSLTLGEDLVYVGALAFSPDGTMLALPEDIPPVIQVPLVIESMRLWNIATEKALLSFSADVLVDIHGLAFSRDGTLLVSANGDGAVHVWNVATGQMVNSLNAHTDLVSGVVFSPDGSVLASASYDGTVVLWDMATGGALRTLSAHTDFVNSVAFSPDGTTLASASNDRTVIVWHVATGQPLRTFSVEDSVTSVAISADGTTLALAGGLNQVQLWDLAGGELLRVLEGHTDSVSCLAFSPDGKTLASGSIDTTIRLWPVATGE